MDSKRKTIRRPVMRLREDGTPYPLNRNDPRLVPYFNHNYGCAFAVSPALLFILLLLMAKVMKLI